mgnify:CR=1 FL=1
MKKIAIIAEYDPSFEPHIATERALNHSAKKLNIPIDYDWVSTENLDDGIFEIYHGIWVGPGSPYKNMAKTISVIKFARENNIPLLGTCGGFQHVILEIAQNILGFKDAEHAEYDPYGSKLFISELSCSLAGRQMQLSLKKDSKVADLYGEIEVNEKYYCNFGVNPQYISELKKAPIEITGSDSEGEIRIVEIPTNKFFIATLFVPQARSTTEKPHPLVNGFLKALE